ncbi:hypothetical protein ASE66_14465 [Bosea sp. Root483D1]|uniref:DUF6538 domain-containing protein n=1 Tax=Bosea sp. Root483D1 TaxID=1736544 RepID=UPI00070A27AE|nr:DUF6538 domain-containing protein [Bosea sp. Root483D1]KRE14560.1 hypothetical protein ASE66_14465 [Bosea sp. Root483D1]
MSRSWKHPKTGIYWFRKCVPDELRILLGKTEEKQSFGTRDPAEAKIKQLEVLVAVEKRWAIQQLPTAWLRGSELASVS